MLSEFQTDCPLQYYSLIIFVVVGSNLVCRFEVRDFEGLGDIWRGSRGFKVQVWWMIMGLSLKFTALKLKVGFFEVRSNDNLRRRKYKFETILT